MTMVHISGTVSFARTPLSEIGRKAEEIRALGWEESRRGDPWVVLYRKHFPEGEHVSAEAELRAVMGDYWLGEDETRELLDSR